jgi:competence protein ComEC
MVKHFSGILFTAAGAVLGFYCIGIQTLTRYLVILFISLAVLCFIRVLSSLNVFFSKADDFRKMRLAAYYSTVFAVGLSIGISMAAAGSSQIQFDLPEYQITAFNGVLLEDPRVISSGRVMAALALHECTGADAKRAKASGELTVFFPQDFSLRLREFGRGTSIYTEGKLRRSQDDVNLTFSAVSVHIVKSASALERIRTNIRLDLIRRFDGSKWGGLSLALLLGIKDNLDSNLSLMYRNAGCSFILALSGMHLAVLAAIIAFLLTKPLGLKVSVITGAVLVITYCFIVGPMPSLNRAAIMYLLGAAAILGALPKEPLNILCLSFLVQIMVSPASGHSISFILSYAALAGILLIGQPLNRLLSGYIPGFLLQPLSASCGAFLATAGITSYTFGVLAPAGIAAGLFLVPLTTGFMILSMAYLALDFISLSFLLKWPLSVLYLIMEKIVSIAARLPRVTVYPAAVLSISLLLSALIPVLYIRRYQRNLKLKPFA